MAITTDSLASYAQGFDFNLVLIIFGRILLFALIIFAFFYVIEKRKYFIPLIIKERHSTGERCRIMKAKEVKQIDKQYLIIWTGIFNVLSKTKRIMIPVNTTDHKVTYLSSHCYFFYKTLEGDYFPLVTNVNLYELVTVSDTIEKRKVDANGHQVYDDKGLPVFDVIERTRQVPRIELLTIPSDLRLFIAQNASMNGKMAKKEGFWEKYGAYIILGSSIAIAFIILALAMKNATELISQTIDKAMIFADKMDKILISTGAGTPASAPVPAP